jgi:hypothetical protein
MLNFPEQNANNFVEEKKLAIANMIEVAIIGNEISRHILIMVGPGIIIQSATNVLDKPDKVKILTLISLAGLPE